MSNTKLEKKNKQHIVPQTYLKLFSYSDEEPYKVFVRDKNKMIFRANIKNIAQERNFYTIDKLGDKYMWENFYAQVIEPFMKATLDQILALSSMRVFQNNANVLNDELRIKLSIIIVCQILRGSYTRDYGKKIFLEKAPEVREEVSVKLNIDKALINKYLKEYILDENWFKMTMMEVVLDMDRIAEYASVLCSRSWNLCKCKDNDEFITSDNPIMLMNINTLDVRPLSNGILNPFTVIFYPISPKLLLVSPEQVMEGNDYFDGGIYFLNTDDVRKINKKQFEQCYRHVYSHSQEILEKL